MGPVFYIIIHWMHIYPLDDLYRLYLTYPVDINICQADKSFEHLGKSTSVYTRFPVDNYLSKGKSFEQLVLCYVYFLFFFSVTTNYFFSQHWKLDTHLNLSYCSGDTLMLPITSHLLMTTVYLVNAVDRYGVYTLTINYRVLLCQFYFVSTEVKQIL